MIHHYAEDKGIFSAKIAWDPCVGPAFARARRGDGHSISRIANHEANNAPPGGRNSCGKRYLFDGRKQGEVEVSEMGNIGRHGNDGKVARAGVHSMAERFP